MSCSITSMNLLLFCGEVWGSINLWFFILKISLHLHHFISCALIIYSIWSVELISNISNCKWVCFFWLKTTNEFGINCNFNFIAKLRYTNRMAQVSDCCALIVGSITVYELSSILCWLDLKVNNSGQHHAWLWDGEMLLYATNAIL